MSDIIGRAEAALELSSHGWITDPEATDLVMGLVSALKAARAENGRLRASMDDCTCPASSLFSGRPGRDCPAHGGGI